MMPWICRNYDPFKVMLVQDSEPAHGAKKVQDFLKENLPLMVPKDIWPSSSPDLNVCDHWLFGIIERESNITLHPSVNSLKAAIRGAFCYPKCPMGFSGGGGFAREFPELFMQRVFTSNDFVL